ncbi:hypothetical protein ABBQ38_001947 [Trebouxia sp. C0009 RCD-2024]
MASDEAPVVAPAYDVEPAGGNRFRQSQAQDILAAVLKEKLFGASYHAENSSAWAREIADEVKARLKGVANSTSPGQLACADSYLCYAGQQKWTRYKYVVQVIIGEQRGEAVRYCVVSRRCWTLQHHVESFQLPCRMGCRCFWDPKTDDYAQQVFSNVSCVSKFTQMGCNGDP